MSSARGLAKKNAWASRPDPGPPQKSAAQAVFQGPVQRLQPSFAVQPALRAQATMAATTGACMAMGDGHRPAPAIGGPGRLGIADGDGMPSSRCPASRGRSQAGRWGWPPPGVISPLLRSPCPPLPRAAEVKLFGRWTFEDVEVRAGALAGQRGRAGIASACGQAGRQAWLWRACLNRELAGGARRRGRPQSARDAAPRRMRAGAARAGRRRQQEAGQGGQGSRHFQAPASRSCPAHPAPPITPPPCQSPCTTGQRHLPGGLPRGEAQVCSVHRPLGGALPEAALPQGAVPHRGEVGHRERGARQGSEEGRGQGRAASCRGGRLGSWREVTWRKRGGAGEG